MQPTTAFVALSVCASAAALSGEIPDERLSIPSRNVVDVELIDRILSDGDVRVLVMGDSFAVSYWTRVFLPIMGLWDYGQPTAIDFAGTPSSRLGRGTVVASPSELVQSPNSMYEILVDEPGEMYFALPLRGITEYHLASGFSAGANPHNGLHKQVVMNDMFIDYAGFPFLGTDEEYRVRLLTWAPPKLAMSVDELEIWGNDTFLGTMHPGSSVRAKWSDGLDPTIESALPTPEQVNASPVDYPMRTPSDAIEDRPTLDIRLPEGWERDGTYAHFAGSVFYKVDREGQRIPGLYYSSLADNSWSYSGYGADEPATGPNHKVFTKDQFRNWLDVTTLDRKQPVVVFFYLAAEYGANQPDNEAEFEAMISQASSVASEIGIENMSFCLVLPHFHRVGSTTGKSARVDIEIQRDAMFAVADRYSNVAAMSLYDATNGVLLSGTQNARTWLTEKGYDNFAYGSMVVDLVNGEDNADLLDGSNLHPASENAAAVYADVARQLLVSKRGCNDADVAAPMGTLDIDDVLGYLDAIVAGSDTADFAPPYGLLDVDDVLSFISSFAEGCP